MVMFGKAIERVGARPVQPRGDLRFAAAQDDGRRRVAANGAAAHADSRHRRGPSHPVCPRRRAQACPRDAQNQRVLGSQRQRSRRRVLPLPVHQPGAVQPRRPGRAEARRVAQQQYAQRARQKPPKLAFDLANHQPHDVYDGPATLTVGGDEHTVRAGLTGYLDPIDGKYHWQGTIFGTKAELPKRPVMITPDSSIARAKITEQTPWGSYSIAGVGAPPYEFT
jgi:Domain of unknown function (DUF4873)